MLKGWPEFALWDLVGNVEVFVFYHESNGSPHQQGANTSDLCFEKKHHHGCLEENGWGRRWWVLLDH